MNFQNNEFISALEKSVPAMADPFFTAAIIALFLLIW